MRRMNVVNRKQALKVVKELDAFPKVPENYKSTSVTGGGVSLVVFILIAVLILSEIIFYASTELKFDYEVDTDMYGKLKINIDMTVAMPCALIGADAVDMTGQDAHMFGKLQHDDAYFELSANQRQYLQVIQQVNGYLRNEYHALQELMWASGIASLYKKGMPPSIPEHTGRLETHLQLPHASVLQSPDTGDDNPSTPPDACRIHGSLDVNKVAGNFHITAGKSVPVLPRGHAHLSMLIKDTDYNFSHRIDHFSFGEPVAGVVNQLDGEEQITNQNFHMYQYFMQIVPTEVRTYAANVDTYQFAVTEKNRTIDHSSGSHGVPGIFVKYDLNSLKIRVREVHQPFGQFLVRIVGIIGGIFSVSGMLHSFGETFADFVCCRFKLGHYKSKQDSGHTNTQTPVMGQSLTDDISTDGNMPTVNLMATDS